MRHAPLIPTLVILGTVAVASAADDFNLQFHGFASQGYLKTHDHDSFGRATENGSFEFNEFAINVIATPIERVRIGVQIIAYDLGKYGNDEPQIDWAYGEYQLPTGVNWFDASVVAGRFKTGHGLYNDYRDLDMTRTSVFLPVAGYSATFRDFFLAANGGQLNATARTSALGSFDVSGFIGTQNLDETEGAVIDIFKSGIAQLSPTIPGVGALTLELESVEALVLDRFSGGYFTWNTPVDGLRFKVSSLYAHRMEASGGTLRATMPVNPGLGAASGASDTTDINILVYHWFDIMAGGEYQTGSWTFAAECSNQYWKAQIDSGPLDFPATGFPGPFPPASVDSAASTQIVSSRTTSAYGSVNYQLNELPGFLSRCHLFAAGNWDRNVFNAVKTYGRSVAVAIRYDVTDHFLIKAEFQRYQDINSSAVHTYGNLFALKTTFDF